MKTFISFVIKEGKHILRDKRTMLILFGMPVVLMLLFGFALSMDVRDVRTVIVTASQDHATNQLVEALSESQYFNITKVVPTTTDAERLIRNQKADMAIVFSPQFANRKFDRESRVQIVTDGSDPNMAQQYAAYASQIFLQHVMAKHSYAAKPSSVSMLLYNPQIKSAYNFVPGIMGMLLMLICAMMTSISIVREKERGTMEVLLVSPVKPLMIIIAKALPYMGLALTILATILLMSYYILNVPLSGSLFWIVMVSLIYILLSLSIGLLISTLAKTQLAALLMSAMVLLMPCVMLSGMMFPIESMPDILQYITYIVPPRYYISAMRKLMIMGVGIDSALQETLILSGMTVLVLSLALLNFNKRLDV